VTVIGLPPDPYNVDVATMRLALPQWTGLDDFDPLPIDAEPHPFDQPVVMVGWSDGSWTLPDHLGHSFEVNEESCLE
jgi:hypothetical protein